MPELDYQRAVCPGSFDPVTNGHLDIIGRAAGVFGEVIVAVGANTAKRNGLFTAIERAELLRRTCAEWDNVSVLEFDGLLVDFCRAESAGTVIKGLRSPEDFSYEQPMADLNRRMAGVETIFWPSDPQWASVSSSLVREIAALGGDISGFVPPEVHEAVTARLSAT